MKRILMLMVLSVMTVSFALGQSKNGFYVDASAGFSNERNGHPVQLTPGLGYKFNDKWACGFRTTLQVGGDTRHYDSFTPYARYCFAKAGNFAFFTEGMASWVACFNSDCDDDPTKADDGEDEDGFEAGLNLGLQYNLSKHFGLFVSGFFLGYSNTGVTHEGAVAGDGRFVLDSNWRRVAIGARIVF